jgi:hypothetical protein
VSAHRDATGQPQHFISVIEDITERRMLEAQVQQATRWTRLANWRPAWPMISTTC